MKINIFWFRRDLRLDDNTGLNQALNSGLPVLPVFIFDTNIIDELPSDDPRVNFIYDSLFSINKELQKSGSSIYILKGDPGKIWKELIVSYDINAVFVNKDYEPYSIERDNRIESLLKKHQISFKRYKDQVIFEESEILKSDNKPYTIFTPYKNRWLQKFTENFPFITVNKVNERSFFYSFSFKFPSLEVLGFSNSNVRVRPYDLSVIPDYHKFRDIPASDMTSYLSPHLRFGTVSIRNLVKIAFRENQTFLNELIWREFFMQILFHFPHVVTRNFRTVYDDIQWINDEGDFKRWCAGESGYPIVDAGMRQLNKTGYMHNRVRMITAGFLCKHLLIDWRWGEAYFAQKLLDYELSSNNGNWQWAAGTGCDAAPYFRIFNPYAQQKKFDPEKEYIRKWIEDFEQPGYPAKIVEHDFARQRAITIYKSGIKSPARD
ncbi:MAG: DNA photolyase family protein [Bacteroidales bacterium]|nr:DNA photolyase family protein [Bacteroidales bacterium]